MAGVGIRPILGGGSGPTMAEIAAALIDPGNPKGESTVPNAGSMAKAQGAGHEHPRLTSAVIGSVVSGNTATISFTRSFSKEPSIDYAELPPTSTTTTPDPADTAASAQPTAFKVVAWQRDGNGNYTGCTIRVWKSQTVPQNLATLLLGGVFNLFAASVVGTRFSLIALARSD